MIRLPVVPDVVYIPAVGCVTLTSCTLTVFRCNSLLSFCSTLLNNLLIPMFASSNMYFLIIIDFLVQLNSVFFIFCSKKQGICFYLGFPMRIVIFFDLSVFLLLLYQRKPRRSGRPLDIRYLEPVLLLTSYTNPATRKRYSSNDQLVKLLVNVITGQQSAQSNSGK